jgi:superfamily II DNA or RNA helicase
MLDIRIGAKAEFTYPSDMELAQHVNNILKDLAYSNPKYEDAQRLGFSTFGIPREIKTYGVSTTPSGTIITFARGELHRFLNASFPVNIIEEFPEITHLPNITYENTEFDLDERQERCVKAILNKKQGVIHAATSAGKSAILMRAIAERKVRTIIVVHRKILLEQLLADARRWLRNCTIGVLQSTSRREGEELPDILFTIDKTLALTLRQNPARISGVGLIIQDEAHLAATSTFQNIIGNSSIHFRYGLTGTVKRKDRMQFLLFATFGPIIATVSKDELEEAGRTTPVETIVHETNTTAPDEVFELSSTKQWQALDKIVHEDEGRLKQAVTITEDILRRSASARVLTVSRYVKPAIEITERLREAGIKVGLVTGQEKENSQTCQDLEDGKIQVIVATIGVVSTGVNIKSLTDLILFSPIFSNELLLHQLRGRCMRVSPGKEKAFMHLMYDGNIWPGRIGRVLSILRR